jgi:nucleotide-binding universal stress UspA family protein
MFKRVLVAVDGSEHAIKAAQLAGDICRSMKADLTLVTVFDPVPNYLGEPFSQDAVAKRIESARSILNEAQNKIGEVPGDVKTDMLEGPVAEAILRLIESRNIDLVIMGTRGLGRLGGLVLGSQSQKVLQHAPCPVLLVR